MKQVKFLVAILAVIIVVGSSFTKKTTNTLFKLNEYGVATPQTPGNVVYRVVDMTELTGTEFWACDQSGSLPSCDVIIDESQIAVRQSDTDVNYELIEIDPQFAAIQDDEASVKAIVFQE